MVRRAGVGKLPQAGAVGVDDVEMMIAQPPGVASRFSIKEDLPPVGRPGEPIDLLKGQIIGHPGELARAEVMDTDLRGRLIFTGKNELAHSRHHHGLKRWRASLRSSYAKEYDHLHNRHGKDQQTTSD